jgi:NhaA family Na+:H+ antiporter
MAAYQPIGPRVPERAIDRWLRPFHEFSRIEAGGGILLLAAAVAALIWANSPFKDSYAALWDLRVTFAAGAFELSKPLRLWVNDGLMSVFFFVVGLEIKREVSVGELKDPRQAAIAVTAAVGGVAVPALLFAALNLGGDGLRGWAIPTATDIAFALGILALAGKGVPIGLKVFLTALAIVDDLCAVLIIAFFYTGHVDATALTVAAAAFATLVAANRLHIRWPLVYAAIGFVLWVAVLKSGVHATIAGVLAAFTIPSRFRIDGAAFTRFAHQAIEAFDAAGGDNPDIMTNADRQQWVAGLEMACEHVQTPLQRLEHLLHPWSSFLIVPVFALANAGVSVGGGLGDLILSPVSLGIVLGLVVGKQVGVTGFTYLAVRSGLGELPPGVTWKQLYAASWLAGIGFTMSLFVGGLAFGESVALDQAKVGVLLASLVAGTVGYTLLRRWSPEVSLDTEGHPAVGPR